MRIDLTAADFEYTWKRTLSPELASPAAWELFYIKGGEEYNKGEGSADDVAVKAVDAKTLEVTLNNPTPYFLYLTAASNFFPVKKDVVEGEQVWTKSGDTYVCNGAFVISEIDQAVLELAAGGVGGFDQHEEALVLAVAHVHKGLHAVRAQVGVHGKEICVETAVGLAAHLHLAQMAGGVGRGGGADVAPLGVADYQKALLLAVIYGFLIAF